MTGGIVRKLAPEEEELNRKRAQLSAVRATLAERELELADLRREIAAFEGRYLREVGVLYAELDDWDARVAELAATLENSVSSRKVAEHARRRASETHEAAHGEASKTRDFRPSADLRNLYREAARRIHPDFAKDDADLERRNRFMAEANEAYARGDAEALQRILDDYHEGSEVIPGERIGAELVRIIRQIAQAQNRIVAIEDELKSLKTSELARLKEDVELAQLKGRDLLSELAATVNEQIARARKEHQVLTQEAKIRGR